MNEALTSVGGFKTSHRGLIDVKVHNIFKIKQRYAYTFNNYKIIYLQGKGLMDTYWLDCKEASMPVHEEISWYVDMQPVFLQQLQKDTNRKMKK